jgi:hypothetical protein
MTGSFFNADIDGVFRRFSVLATHVRLLNHSSNIRNVRPVEIWHNGHNARIRRAAQGAPLAVTPNVDVVFYYRSDPERPQGTATR